MAKQQDPQVYLIGSPDSPLVKIGTTQDIKSRLRGIQNMSPAKLEVLWHTEGGLLMERVLHERFRKYRRHGEWFDFGSKDPVELVSSAAAELDYLIPVREYVHTAPEATSIGVQPDSDLGLAPAAPAHQPPGGRNRLKLAFTPPLPVSRGFLLDSRLSAFARGIGAYTLAALDGASENAVSCESIASANACTAEQLDAAFDELRDAGYLRDEDGHWFLSDLRSEGGA